MEVVLSPGRYGDDGPGVPYQNEEIREWSHVDRLTGMLERARVETGRWKTLNHGDARSYGKVIDSRERNSADGSVIQRARRQVEVFQSEGPGRSVQVVRASQWSSSRVTDSSTTSSLGLLSLPQKKNSAEPIENSSPSIFPTAPSSSHLLHRDESISDRLSTLLGSFAHNSSSSTVPLRRIDSKYSTRVPLSLPLSRLSNSNDNLADRSTNPIVQNFTDSKNRESTNKTNYFQRIDDRSSIVHENERKRICEIANCEIIDDSSMGTKIDEIRPITKKSAIKLLPSNKANKTVVNLINQSKNVNDNVNDIVNDDDNDKTLTWTLPTYVADDKCSIARKNDEKSVIEESAMSLVTTVGRSAKRVGFCKTEIHFAADSGKVNIVETDGKPPPTNKFRRRRRNSTVGLSCGKSETIDDRPNVGTIDRVERLNDVEDVGGKTDPNLHRGHTTTVKLGCDRSIGNEITDRGFPESRRAVTHTRTHNHNRNHNFTEPHHRRGSSPELRLRLDNNRIYDRLTTYTSETIVNSSVPEILTPATTTTKIDDDERNALKSTRLVMNLTRVPDVESSVSKVIVEGNDSMRNSSTNLDGPDNDEFIDDDEFTFVRIGPECSAKIIENDFEIREPCETIVESPSNEKIVRSTNSPSNCSTNIDEKVTSEICNVLCTDTDENRVFSKIVKLHEPTIARVETENPRKITRTKNKSTTPSKSAKSLTKNFENSSKKSLKQKREHTYVNVFRDSKNAPIYENYKPIDVIPMIDDKNFAQTKNDENSSKEKNNCAKNEKFSQRSSCCGRLKKSDKIDEKTLNVVQNVEVDCHAISQDVKKLSSKKTRRRIVDESPMEMTKNREKNVEKKLSISRSSSSSIRDDKIVDSTNNLDRSTKRKPVQVVYQTAVYNMKNERLKKPQKSRESKGPRYLNELICGAKIKRPSEAAKIGKGSSTSQKSANKSASQPIKHWK